MDNHPEQKWTLARGQESSYGSTVSMFLVFWRGTKRIASVKTPTWIVDSENKGAMKRPQYEGKRRTNSDEVEQVHMYLVTHAWPEAYP